MQKEKRERKTKKHQIHYFFRNRGLTFHCPIVKINFTPVNHHVLYLLLPLFFQRDPVLTTNFSDCPKICDCCQDRHHAFVKGQVSCEEEPCPGRLDEHCNVWQTKDEEDAKVGGESSNGCLTFLGHFV